MERIGSTLTVTALAITGLVIAARIINPGDVASEQAAPPAAMVVATAPAPAEPAHSAWTDPPARTVAQTQAPVAEEAPPAPVAKSDEDVKAEAALAEAKAQAERKDEQRRAERRRREVAQSKQRERRLAARRNQELYAAAVPAQTQRPAQPMERRIDPIGDFFRGLGFGRGGQG